jgi:hypothetical protein
VSPSARPRSNMSVNMAALLHPGVSPPPGAIRRLPLRKSSEHQPSRKVVDEYEQDAEKFL